MTTIVTAAVPYLSHKRHDDGFILIRGKWRCRRCGHRVVVDGVPPVSTRYLPPREWPVELIDRRTARRKGAIWMAH